MKQLLTFVIPAWNVAPYLKEAVNSALECESTARVIILDDGADDGAGDVAQAIAEVDSRVVFVAGRNGGACQTRNRGLALVTTELVCFLDGDDVVVPGVLDNLCRHLANRPDCSVAYSNFVRISETGERQQVSFLQRLRPRPSGMILRSLMEHTVIGVPGGAVVRTSRVREVGGWCGELKAAQDWELWCRLGARGKFLFVNHEPGLLYRQRIGSITQTNVGSLVNYQQANDKVFSNPEIIRLFDSTTLRKMRNRRNAHLHGLMAYGLSKEGRLVDALRSTVKAIWLAPERTFEFLARLILGLAHAERPYNSGRTKMSVGEGPTTCA